MPSRTHAIINESFSAMEQHCTNTIHGACNACAVRQQCQEKLTPLMDRLFSAVRDLADEERTKLRSQNHAAGQMTGNQPLGGTQKIVDDLSCVLLDCDRLPPIQIITDALRYAGPLHQPDNSSSCG